MSKRQVLITEWQVHHKFPLVNDPFEFELRTAVQEPNVFNENRNPAALRRHIHMPSPWYGKTYPMHQGWNRISLESESKEGLDFYVVDSLSWLSLRANALQVRNRRYFDGSLEQIMKTNITSPIEQWWFFLIALLGLGYLWLHPKMFKN